MRLTTLLLVSALAAAGLAGCFGKTDSGTDGGSTGGNTTTTTPTTGGSPTVTPTTGGNSTGGGSTTVAPKEIVSKKTHDFSQDVAPGGTPLPVPTATPDKFTVDVGYTKLMVNVTLAVENSLPVGPNNAVTVKVGTFTCAADNPQPSPGKTCTGSIAATPGPGQIEYSGAGPIQATISIIEA